MNKKIIISLSIILVAAAVIIGGTTAYFSDEETSAGNTFAAGSVDLKVDSTCHYNGRECVYNDDLQKYFWTGTEEECFCTWGEKDLDGEIFFNYNDVKPGDTGENTISLHVNDNDAWVCAQMKNITNDDNGCNEPEGKVDSTCGAGEGELQANLLFNIWQDTGVGGGVACDNIHNGTEPIIENLKMTNLIWPIADSRLGAPLTGDETFCLGVSWTLPSGVGNEVQTDSLKGDFVITAIQSRHLDDFVCSDLNGGNETDPRELACVNSGGTVSTGTCCLATSDFPATCSTGACGCGPDSSHEVKTCVCPAGTCFDGETCVGISITECISNSDCNDNDVCNTDVCNAQNVCEHEPIVYADANPCTLEYCDPATGVQYPSAPDGTTCALAFAGTCLSGVCTMDDGTTELICDDAVDNDGDGQTDCADSDCAANLICQNTDVDSDGDGVSDFGDNCIDVLNPNQRDYDGDGLGDACDATPGGPEICGDGVDNDGNGQTDENCPWINEIHYDNAGVDTNEGVEIAGKAGIDLTGWKIVLYNGSGGASYSTLNLSGIIINQQNGYGTLWFAAVGMHNGDPDGLALVDPNGVVIKFLSYEGSFTATNGPADGMTSVDIGVFESNAEQLGQSLQLSGFGNKYADFTWGGPTNFWQTYGTMNVSQVFN